MSVVFWANACLSPQINMQNQRGAFLGDDIQKANAEVPLHHNQAEGECKIVKLYALKMSVSKLFCFYALSFFTLGLVALLCRWVISIKRALCYEYCRLSEATDFLVLNWDGSWSIHQKLTRYSDGVQIIYFQNRFLLYQYSQEDLVFKPALFQIGAEGDNPPLTRLQVLRSLQQFGRNEIKVIKSSWLSLLLDQVLNPFVLFEIFSVSVWIIEEYAQYAFYVTIATLLSILYDVHLIRCGQDKLRSNHPQNNFKVRVMRQQGQLLLSSEQVVPGDHIIIQKQIPCDCLILEGSAIVDQRPLAMNNYVVKSEFNGNQTLESVILMGSLLIQNKIRAAIALRTGFSTTKGQLVRASLFPQVSNFKAFKDPVKMLMILFFLTLSCFIYFCMPLFQWLSIFNLIIIFLDLLTTAVPPSLPLALTVGIGVSLQQLDNRGIVCISPPKIAQGGQTDIIILDKNQTIVNKHNSLAGFLKNNSEGTLDFVQNIEQEDLGLCSSLCHSLILQPVPLGDPIQLRIYQTTKGFSKGATRTHIRKNKDITLVKVNIPNLLRSVTIIKGHWESLQSYHPQSKQFIQMAIDNYQRKGFLIECFIWDMPGYFVFVGGVLIHRTIREQAAQMLEWVQSSKIRVAIVSEDEMSVSSSIFNKIKLLRQQQPIALSQLYNLNNNLSIQIEQQALYNIQYHSTELVKAMTFELRESQEDCLVKSYLNIVSEYEYIAVNGQLFDFLLSKKSLIPILSKIKLFTSFTNIQRAQLVKLLQSQKLVVAMLSNPEYDTLALRQANIGMSLIDSDTPMSSQLKFTTNRGISALKDLLSYCRVAMNSNFLTFKIQSMFSLIQGITTLLLYRMFTQLNTHKSLFQDIAIAGPIFLTILIVKPTQQLDPRKPPHSLFSKRNLISIVTQTALFFIAQLWLVLVLQNKQFYKGTQSNKSYLVNYGSLIDSSIETDSLFLFSNFLYIGVAIAFTAFQNHVKSLFQNYLLLGNIVLLQILSLMLWLTPQLLPKGLRIEGSQQWQRQIVVMSHVWSLGSVLLQWIVWKKCNEYEMQ